jgi:hypothetical protein
VLSAGFFNALAIYYCHLWSLITLLAISIPASALIALFLPRPTSERRYYILKVTLCIAIPGAFALALMGQADSYTFIGYIYLPFAIFPLFFAGLLLGNRIRAYFNPHPQLPDPLSLIYIALISLSPIYCVIEGLNRTSLLDSFSPLIVGPSPTFSTGRKKQVRSMAA